MNSNKTLIYVRLSILFTIVIFLVFLYKNKPPKAFGVLFFSGGVLGLITKTMPFKGPPKGPVLNYKITYKEDSIIGPLMNILNILLGIVFLFI